MRANPLTLLLLFCMGLAASGAAASDVPDLGWTWDQVALRPAQQGEVECLVQNANLCLSQPGEPGLPAMIVRVEAPDGSSPATFELAGVETSMRPLEAPIAPVLEDAPGVVGGPRRAPIVAAAYDAPRFPAERIRFLGMSLQRGKTIASFAVYPVVLEGRSRMELLERANLLVSWKKDPAVALPLKVLRKTEAQSGALGADPSGSGRPVRQQDGAVDDLRPSLTDQPVEYLVLTSEAFKSSVTAILDWKRQIGLHADVRTVEWVETVYTDGVDRQDRIRNFLKDAYQYWGTEWLLIVGDPSQVPIRTAKSYAWNCPAGTDIITDLYYACLDGDWNHDGDALFGEPAKTSCPDNPVDDQVDFDAELYTGRIPAKSLEELGRYIANYTKYVQTPVRDGYLDRFLLLGEVLFHVDWTRSELPSCARCTDTACSHCVSLDGASDCLNVIDRIRTGNLGFNLIEMYEWFEYWRDRYDRDNAVLLKKSDVVAQLNQGVGWVHHVGHGDRDRIAVGTSNGTDGQGRYLVSDARDMSNMNKPGIVYSINCNSAAVDYDCLAEAMLTAENGGMIMYVGSSNLDFPSAATYFQNSTYEKILVQRERYVGKAFYETIAEQMAGQESRDTYFRFLAYSLMLLGEPHLTTWLRTPDVIAAVKPETITLGDANVQVSVTRGGSPLAGATVTCYKADENLIVSAFSGANGQAIVPFRPSKGGTFRITVTHPEGVPVIDGATGRQIRTPSSSLLVATGLSVVDQQGNEIDGNGNGRIEEGETVKLSVSLRNGGQAASTPPTQLSLSIEPVDMRPYVEILDSVENVGTSIGIGSTAQIAGAFRIRTKPVPGDMAEFYQNGDRLPVRALVQVTEGARVAVQEFSLPITKPRFDLILGSLSEVGGGDGDSQPDNGERMSWVPTLYNIGAGAAHDLKATLTAVSGATMVAGYEQFDLEDGEQGQSLRTVASAGFRFDVTNASQLSLRFTVRSAFNPDFVFFDRVIDLIRPNAPTFPLGAPPQATKDAILLTWIPDPLQKDIQGYSLSRSTSQNGTYERVHNGVLHDMEFYKDEGLAGLSVYWYKVASVDSSGNQSPLSPPVQATTNPGQLPGWPFNVRQDPNLGCPTIENLDKMGDCEVFISADRLYGLNSDGVEIRDGDNVPSTPGVWTGDGAFFWTKPAIGDLDGDGTAEVVAAARYRADDSRTGTVFVWNADGTLRWSKQVGNSNALLGSPVIANIAGSATDGKKEVIVQNRGCLYAWTSTGSPVVTANTDGKLAYVGGGNEGDPGTWPYAYGSPAVANLDAEPLDEVVFGLSKNMSQYPAVVVVVDGTGEVLATSPTLETGANDREGAANSSPSIADIDDQSAGYEILWTTRKHLYCLKYDKDSRQIATHWQVTFVNDPLPTSWLEATPAIGDISGDGKLDVVVGIGNGKLIAVNHLGAYLSGWPKTITAEDKKLGSAILVNLDQDLPAEIVLGDSEGIVRALNADGSTVPGFPYTMGGRIQSGIACWDVDRAPNRHPELVIQSDQLASISVLEVTSTEFPTTLDQQMVRFPWTSFRHDAMNTGRMDQHVVTPVRVFEVAASDEPGAAVLNWVTPGGEASTFRVMRRDAASEEWAIRAEGSSQDFLGHDGHYTYRDVAPAGRYVYRVHGYDGGGEEAFLSNETEVIVRAVRLEFTGIVPNPTRGDALLRFTAPAGPIRVDIVDLAGRRVRALADRPVDGGIVEILWDGRDDEGRSVGAGVYWARLERNGQTKTEQIVLLK